MCMLKLSLMAMLLCLLQAFIPAGAQNATWTQTCKPLAFNYVNEQVHKNYAYAKDEIR
jgi:hypothetical protein